MKVIEENPIVLQTPWEIRSGGKECYLLTAYIEKGKASILSASVFVRADEDTPRIEEMEVKSRLEDLKDDFKLRDESNS